MVEILVALADIFPIVRQTLEPAGIQSGIALLTAQRLDNGVERRLAGQTGERRNRAVDDIHTGFRRQKVGRNLVVGGVMAVQMHRNADLLLERIDQLLGRIGLEQARHILDAKGVRAAPLELFGKIDIVLKRVFVSGFVEDISRVADRGLQQLALL